MKGKGFFFHFRRARGDYLGDIEAKNMDTKLGKLSYFMVRLLSSGIRVEWFE